MTLDVVQPLYLGENNLVRWERAQTASDSAYVNAGSGSWQLKDAAGTVLDSGVLAYVPSTSGRWQAVIDRATTSTLTEGATYYVEVTLANGFGADGFRRIECVAQYHDF